MEFTLQWIVLANFVMMHIPQYVSACLYWACCSNTQQVRESERWPSHTRGGDVTERIHLPTKLKTLTTMNFTCWLLLWILVAIIHNNAIGTKSLKIVQSFVVFLFSVRLQNQYLTYHTSYYHTYSQVESALAQSHQRPHFFSSFLWFPFIRLLWGWCAIIRFTIAGDCIGWRGGVAGSFRTFLRHG